MCMSRVKSTVDEPDTAGVDYAVRHDGRDDGSGIRAACFDHIQYRLKRWYSSGRPIVLRGEDGSVYQSGFHVFTSLSSARRHWRYAKTLKIFRVKWKHRVAIGYDGDDGKSRTYVVRNILHEKIVE